MFLSDLKVLAIISSTILIRPTYCAASRYEITFGLLGRSHLYLVVAKLGAGVWAASVIVVDVSVLITVFYGGDVLKGKCRNIPE